MNQPTHIIPSREDILGLLRGTSEPLDIAGIARKLRVKKAAIDVLTRRLSAMERDGQIVMDDEGNFSGNLPE